MRVRILTRRPDGGFDALERQAAAVAIGSSPHGTVVLTGARVAALHLLLERGADGVWRAQAQGPYHFRLDGVDGLKEARLEPGQVLGIGPHEVLVRPASQGADLVLEVRPDAGVDRRVGPLTLAEAGLRMRRPAWILGVTLLGLCLLIPWVMATLPPGSAPRAILPTDGLWSSGRISNAHQHLAGDCRSCHEQFFVPVRDTTCLGCHDGLGTHSASPALLQASGLDERACASCHKEHGGTHAVLPTHPGLCTDCHARPHREDWAAHLPPVRDFGRAHPPFRVRVIGGWSQGQPLWQRVALNADVRDYSGLIYPHDLHLAPDLAGPAGPETLACADCHRPGPGRVGFEPIAFEPHCQRCHALEVETAADPVRLPHGDLDAARWMLARLAETVISGDEPHADELAERRRAGLVVDRGAGLTPEEWVESQIEARLCAKCHEVPEPGKGIAPVHLAQSWWPAARFSHAPHQATDCAVCHSAEASSAASDLLLPPIETCRSCHGGVASAQGIRSTCVDCHGFHQVRTGHRGEATGAGAHARGGSTVAGAVGP